MQRTLGICPSNEPPTLLTRAQIRLRMSETEYLHAKRQGATTMELQTIQREIAAHTQRVRDLEMEKRA
jgi:hypothetical protein